MSPNHDAIAFLLAPGWSAIQKYPETGMWEARVKSWTNFRLLGNSDLRRDRGKRLFTRHHRSFEQGKHPLGHESQPRHGRENEKRRKTELRDKTRRTSLSCGIGFFYVCAFLPPAIEAECHFSGWTTKSA